MENCFLFIFSQNGTEKYNEKFRQDFYEDPTLLNGDPLRILDNVANHQCVYAGVSVTLYRGSITLICRLVSFEGSQLHFDCMLLAVNVHVQLTFAGRREG